MADATTAAKDRIDRALAALERNMHELKARPASAPALADDDLFAGSPAGLAADSGTQARIAELEAAGRDASAALARASEKLRGLLAPTDEDEG